MSYPEAHEMVLEGLIPKDGPEFSDNPPKPLSYRGSEKGARHPGAAGGASGQAPGAAEETRRGLKPEGQAASRLTVDVLFISAALLWL